MWLLFQISNSRFILWMHPANERRRYIVTSSLIGWVHSQDDPCNFHIKDIYLEHFLWNCPRVNVNATEIGIPFCFTCFSLINGSLNFESWVKTITTNHNYILFLETYDRMTTIHFIFLPRSIKPVPLRSFCCDESGSLRNKKVLNGSSNPLLIHILTSMGV